MIKKICLILLSIFLLLSFGVYAEELSSSATEIISPSNGDKVGEEFEEISFTAPEDSYTALILDGNEIFSGVSAGLNTAVVSDELSFGEHTLTLTSVLGNAFEEDSIKFVKEKVVSKAFDSVVYRDFGTYEAGVDTDGNKVYAFPKKFPGRDDSVDGSDGYIIENLNGRIITKGSLAYDCDLKEYAADMTDKVTLSFDLKINNAYYFEFEMKNGDGGWINPGGKSLFKNDLKIGTSGKSYVNNEWMAVEIVFDVPKQTIAIFIDGEEVISEYKAEAHLKGLQMIRFLFCPRPVADVQSYAFDNFKMITEKRYDGFDDVTYKSGEEFIPVTNNAISEEFSEIKFKTDMVFDTFASDFSVKCYADGREVGVSEISEEQAVNEESGLLENYLNVKLSDNLFGESDLKFVIENVGADDKEITFEKNISLCTEEFCIDNIDFSANDKPCISNGQLKEGDTLKAVFNFKNYTDEKPVCVVGIYSGNKLVSLTSKTAQGASCDVETVIPAADEEYKVQCFIINGYGGRKVLSNNKTIGGK